MNLTEIIESLDKISISKLKYLVIVIILFLILFPFIDKLFIRNYIITQKIEITQKYSELLKNQFDCELNKRLIASIENDINNYLQENKQEYNPIKSMKVNFGKFISGTFLWIIVFIIMLFQKTTFFKKIGSLIVVLVFGFFCGYISSIIPIIIHPSFNYIGFNVLEILFIYSLLSSNKQKKT